MRKYRSQGERDLILEEYSRSEQSLETFTSRDRHQSPVLND
jgi:hypothetical protein